MVILMLEQFISMGVNMYREKIVDTITGEESFRNYTAEEIAKVESEIEKTNLELAEIAAKEAARQAILEKLGLTAEEAKILLG